MELVQRITKEIIDSEKAYAPEYIIGKVADFYDISPEDVIGKGKTKDVANARQISTYLIRKLTGQTLEQIGEVMGRDHTTVLHSIPNITGGWPVVTASTIYFNTKRFSSGNAFSTTT